LLKNGGTSFEMKAKKSLLSVLAVFIVFYVFAETEEKDASKDIYDNLDIFASGLALVQRDYVEEVEPQKIIYGALKGMMGALDPHSQFLDQEAYREMQVDTEGEFGGLGIEITVEDNFLRGPRPSLREFCRKTVFLRSRGSRRKT
jgi:C-terminal processing protease CtpA/Prc